MTLDQLNRLAAWAGIIAGVALLPAGIARCADWWRRWRVRGLAEVPPHADVFTREALAGYARYYVEPYLQSIDPEAHADEPGLMAASRELAFRALDRLLVSPTQYRFIAILAGSGMGKSALLVNYFARTQRRWRRPFSVALVPLGTPDADQRIGRIPNPQDTVLLLDALDEDPAAIQDHRTRLSELLRAAAAFKKVVITCRSQFFLSEEEEPGETGLLRVTPRGAGQPAGLRFHKLYLSPLDDAQVLEYLHSRFPIWRFRERASAVALARAIPRLTVRPMLLTYIDYLIQMPPEGHTLDGLYAAMIDAWLTREQGLLRVNETIQLKQFSSKLALNLWLHRDLRGTERVPAGQIEGLAAQYGVPLAEWKLRGRSLLNRDAAGNLKFAHRSILEYFVVREFLGGDSSAWCIYWTDQMHEFLRASISHEALSNGLSFARRAVLLNLEIASTVAPGAPRDAARERARAQAPRTRRGPIMPKRLSALGKSDPHGVVLPGSSSAAGPVSSTSPLLHIIQDIEATSTPMGRGWVNHSQGIVWWLASGKQVPLRNAREVVAEADRTRLLGLQGWRIPDWHDARLSVYSRWFANDWWWTSTSRPPTSPSFRWGHFSQIDETSGHFFMLAQLDDENRRDRKARVCLVADL